MKLRDGSSRPPTAAGAWVFQVQLGLRTKRSLRWVICRRQQSKASLAVFIADENTCSTKGRGEGRGGERGGRWSGGRGGVEGGGRGGGQMSRRGGSNPCCDTQPRAVSKRVLPPAPRQLAVVQAGCDAQAAHWHTALQAAGSDRWGRKTLRMGMVTVAAPSTTAVTSDTAACLVPVTASSTFSCVSSKGVLPGCFWYLARVLRMHSRQHNAQRTCPEQQNQNCVMVRTPAAPNLSPQRAPLGQR